jgi:hypothetical protein
MNIQWSNMTGFGPAAWNHGGPSLRIPSMVHNHEHNTELILHSHVAKPGSHHVSLHLPHKAHHDEEG